MVPGPCDPFEPRFVRYVAWSAVLVLVLGAAVVLVLAPGSGGRGYGAPNVLGITIVVLTGCTFLWRQATVRALVDESGITVRNLLRVRRFSWEQILSVSFGSGDPWVMLELSDGQRFAMMAIQRSDGRRAEREAARLRALVTRYGEAPDRRIDR